VSAAAEPIPIVLDATHLSPSDVTCVLSGAGVARPAVALFDVTGPGAVACVQGLVTSDIDKPGAETLTYGAVLTVKGMIRTDLWVWRRAGGLRLCAPQAGRDALAEVLARSLPPRLARHTEITQGVEVYRLVGPRSLDVAAGAGLPLPEPGCVAHVEAQGTSLTVARPPLMSAPFALEVHVQGEHGSTNLLERVERSGAARVGDGALELARLLAGWPRLGAEIDEKTLPQEVRFDDIGGLSYTKGCYTGQETVARLHFRGHANRRLAGLVWHGAPDPNQSATLQDDRPLGQVTGAAWLGPRQRWVGLAKLRRELDRSKAVTAAGAAADVVPLPFALSA
jgi:folate-binding protein YgfZ